jgi:insertion element IS1 protein InsB
MVSERWLQTYVNRLYARVPRRVAKHRPGTGLCLECDELWSFVGNKGNKQWVYPKGHKWLALDRKPPPSSACRSVTAAGRVPKPYGTRCPKPTASRLSVTRTIGKPYAKVFPEGRHVAAGKDSGLTNHIERFNNTLRHRVSRLVKSSLAFL